jgi:hypothetical protein
VVDGRKLAALSCALLTAFLWTTPAHADAPEGCGAYESAPSCTYTATTNGGVAGYGASPKGWSVKIVRKGQKPIVITSHGGAESYACGAIAPGDKVTATAKSGSFVSVGNPGFCI